MTNNNNTSATQASGSNPGAIRRPKGAGRKTPFIGKIRRKPAFYTGVVR